ncbi:hypothetical protein ACWCP6_00680 [Streptomyces sp. NPDC002004]
MSTDNAPTVLVEVAEYAADNRYRRVHFEGTGWESLEQAEFEPRIRQLFPDLDPHDPARVHWADRPWEWPPWHPGEA